MTAVDSARDELDAALVVNEALLEGARHLAELSDLTSDTRADVERSVQDYDRRNGLLKAAKEALAALDRDDYPNVPQVEVDESVLKDLQQDFATIQAALAKFSSNAATSLGLTGGGSLPKE